MITVAQYISRRLLQLGVGHLFSVPGNYTAEFLLAADEEGIECVGTTNELEAGYAADAYARYAAMGVCSATYGVGSQSLYNAIAGAYVEFCPVLLINGSPPLKKIKDLEDRGILFAHAIDTIRTDELIFRPVTAATAIVSNGEDAPRLVDEVLSTCLRSSRPVYLEVNQGVWEDPCEEPIGDLSSDAQASQDVLAATEAAVQQVLARISQAERPILWAGEMLQRRHLSEVFRTIVAVSKLPYTTTLMAKSILPESEFVDQFIGVYDSKFAPSGVRDVVESSDCLVSLGTILSDFYGDIVAKSYDKLILASDDSVRIGHLLYPSTRLDLFAEQLADGLTEANSRTIQLPGFAELKESRSSSLAAFAGESTGGAGRQLLTYETLFGLIGQFLTKDMTLLVDTSLALFPAAEVVVERQAGFVAQTAWLSIGYTCGAGLGVNLANGSRPIVVVGDGGFQMLPQSFSTLVRSGSSAVVFVLDNATYGIEQYLVDMQILAEDKRFFQNRLPEPSFFDVLPRWDYVKLAEAFGGRGRLVETVPELSALLSGELLEESSVPMIVAVRIPLHDLPPEIAATIPSTAGFEADSPRRRSVALDAFN